MFLKEYLLIKGALDIFFSQNENFNFKIITVKSCQKDHGN